MGKIQSIEPNIADLVNGWLKSYGLDYKLEQESLNAEIDKALDEYKSKSGGTGGNRPDAKLLLQDEALNYYPILIEYKQNSTVDLDYAENLPDSDPYKKIHVGIAKVGDYFKPTVILQSQASDKSLMFYYNNNRFLD